jgi:outer membrane protein assembly factor BamB
MQRSASALAVLLLLAATAGADNWPAWRGGDGQGQCAEKGLPLTWSAKENVRWKTPLPDAGCSTPVIWGDRVFVTQAGDKTMWPPKGSNGGLAIAKKRSLLCLERASGKILWQKDVLYPEQESTHQTNPFCSASPVTDGERIIVSFGSAGMYCYDFKGNELWKKDLGKLEHIWGNASSPILYGDLAILWCGPGDRQFLLAVNKKTGAKAWQTDVPGGSYSAKGTWLGSWSTPVIAKVNGKDQLVLGVPKKLKGFDPDSGKELWSCDGMGNLVYTSPLIAGDIAVAMSGFNGPALAVKLGGTGDITKDRLWHHEKNTQRVGSGVIVGEHVYIVEASGVPHCYELKSGKEVWKADRPADENWSSMVHADGRLYVTTRSGSTLVFAANPKYELLATNRLNEHTDSSIAISNGDIFIRTYKNLWCIGKTP